MRPIFLITCSMFSKTIKLLLPATWVIYFLTTSREDCCSVSIRLKSILTTSSLWCHFKYLGMKEHPNFYYPEMSNLHRWSFRASWRGSMNFEFKLRNKVFCSSTFLTHYFDINFLNLATPLNLRYSMGWIYILHLICEASQLLLPTTTITSSWLISLFSNSSSMVRYMYVSSILIKHPMIWW